jgi:hypothetical protein
VFGSQSTKLGIPDDLNQHGERLYIVNHHNIRDPLFTLAYRWSFHRFRFAANSSSIAAIPICLESGFMCCPLFQCIVVNTRFLVAVFKEGTGNGFFRLSVTCHTQKTPCTVYRLFFFPAKDHMKGLVCEWSHVRVMFKLLHYSSLGYCTKNVNMICQNYIYQFNCKWNVLMEPQWCTVWIPQL